MNKIDFISALVKRYRAKKVLDIGCYNLRQYEAIKRTGWPVDYVGVDVKSLDWDRYKPDKHVRLFKQDIDGFLRASKEKFDVIIYSGMFDWLGDEDEMFAYNAFDTLGLIKNHLHADSKLIFVAVNNGIGRRLLNLLLGRGLPQMRYMVDYDIISEDLRRLGYDIVENLYLPWETKFFEFFRKTFLIGKWANNELVIVCKKSGTSS